MSEDFALPTLDLTEGAAFGMGFRDTIPVAVPAAGNPASIKLDNQYIFHLLSATVTLVSSAAVATRQLQVSATDQNGNTLWQITNPVTQAASLTQSLQLISGFSQVMSALPAAVVVPIPDILLPRNAVLTFSALSIQAADQITVAQLFVEKYPSGVPGYPTGNRIIRL